MTDETKTLQERLRGCAQRCQLLYDEDAGTEETIQAAAWRLTEAADALDAKDALLRQAAEVLRGVIAVADRKTVEFDRVRALLLQLNEAVK